MPPFWPNVHITNSDSQRKILVSWKNTALSLYPDPLSYELLTHKWEGVSDFTPPVAADDITSLIDVIVGGGGGGLLFSQGNREQPNSHFAVFLSWLCVLFREPTLLKEFLVNNANKNIWFIYYFYLLFYCYLLLLFIFIYYFIIILFLCLLFFWSHPWLMKGIESKPQLRPMPQLWLHNTWHHSRNSKNTLF